MVKFSWEKLKTLGRNVQSKHSQISCMWMHENADWVNYEGKSSAKKRRGNRCIVWFYLSGSVDHQPSVILFFLFWSSSNCWWCESTSSQFNNLLPFRHFHIFAVVCSFSRHGFSKLFFAPLLHSCINFHNVPIANMRFCHLDLVSIGIKFRL